MKCRYLDHKGNCKHFSMKCDPERYCQIRRDIEDGCI